VPPSLNWDEVSIGYNAYSILKTGRDEWGQFLPLHFKSYGEYKLPAQIYFSIPAIFIFGLKDFGVRITPVIYGTLTVLLLYFLTFELFGKANLALLASFLLSISPWHIQLTRASFESSFSVFWIVLGIWLFVKGIKDGKWLIASTFAFIISIYTYNSARVFTPLFLAALVIVYFKNFARNKKYLLTAIVLFFLLLLPLIPFVLKGEASARYKLVSISDEAGLVPRINERRGMSKLPWILPRLVHNKVTYLSYYFVRNYLSHFTPDFLFLSGAGHKQHHVQGMGELYKFQAPFLILGFFLILKKREKHRKLLFSWLFIAFIPVATTQDSIPNALRTLIAAPVYQIITAYGLVGVWRYIAKISTRALVAFALILIFFGGWEFESYIRNLFVFYSQKYSRDWQYGYKQVVSYIESHYNDYDMIVFSRFYGEPHMFTLFYLQYPPSSYMNNPNLIRFKAYDWVWVTKFDKFYFPNLSDDGTRFEDIVREYPGKKMLFIGKPGDFPVNNKELYRINFLDNTPAFLIVDNL